MFRYRFAVIKALPQLQKLDNIQVNQDELKEAQRKGRNLIHPDVAQDDTEEEEEYQQQQYNNRYQQEYTEYSNQPQTAPIKQEASILAKYYDDISHVYLFFIYKHSLH